MDFTNRIKFANIPIYGGDKSLLLEGLSYSDKIQMALTHLVESDDSYMEAYKEQSEKHGDFIILDNSLIELGEAIVDMDKILSAAGKIGAREIVLPDVFKNGTESTALTISVAENYSWAHKKYDFMGVAQGLQLEEFIESFELLLDHELIDTIGIPKVMSTMEESEAINRNYILGELFERGLLQEVLDKGKNIHLLGAWTISDMFLHPKYFKYIRSMDTVLPNWEALHGVSISDIPFAEREIRTEGKVVHEDSEQVPPTELAKQNIETVKDWMWHAYEYAYNK